MQAAEQGLSTVASRLSSLAEETCREVAEILTAELLTASTDALPTACSSPTKATVRHEEQMPAIAEKNQTARSIEDSEGGPIISSPTRVKFPPSPAALSEAASLRLSPSKTKVDATEDSEGGPIISSPTRVKFPPSPAALSEAASLRLSPSKAKVDATED